MNVWMSQHLFMPYCVHKQAHASWPSIYCITYSDVQDIWKLFCIQPVAPSSSSAPATKAALATPTSGFSHSYPPLQQYTPKVSLIVSQCIAYRFHEVYFRVQFLEQTWPLLNSKWSCMYCVIYKVYSTS